ncbi:MAG: TetR/AcrR family transcriptional regulator [Clostridia bacterium]|nr:TetR/AcrR family transcriptional regulator [Clostridia bacterium]
MPKIIENLREKLLAEARRQTNTLGYGKTTIRSIAVACGVGVGTVYNYFDSKDVLIAAYMLEDWNESMSEMRKKSSLDAKTQIFLIYDTLLRFIDEHRALFCDKDATKAFALSFADKHKILRLQIAEQIIPLCERAGVKNKDFTATVIAEIILTFTSSGVSFNDIYEAVSKLLFAK